MTGSDEGPTNYAGLHDELSNIMSAQSGAEQTEEPGGRTGDGINDDTELEEGPDRGRGR